MPIEFTFNFILEIVPQQGNPSSGTSNIGGKMAVALRLAVGEQYYLAKTGLTTLLQSYAATVLEVQNIAGVIYSIFDINYDATVSGVQLYTHAYISSVKPVFALFVNDKHLLYVDGYESIQEGKIGFDAGVFLKYSFKPLRATFLQNSVDLENDYISYRVDYGVGVSLERGETKYATHSVVQVPFPACANTTAQWADIEAYRCEKQGNTQNNTGRVVVSQRDLNPYSATYNTTRVFIAATDYLLCPLTFYQSTARTASFARNNCPANQQGGIVSYTAVAGAYTSSVSVEDADYKRDVDFNIQAQNYANSVGTCTLVSDNNASPQFAGAIICTDDFPRIISNTRQRMKDLNQNSATYLLWRKTNDTYVTLETDGDYFDTGKTDVVMCRLQGTIQIRLLYKNSLGQTVAFPSGAVPRVGVNYVAEGASLFSTSTSNQDIFADAQSALSVNAGIQQGANLMAFEKFFINATTTVTTNPLTSSNWGTSLITIEIFYKQI